MINTQTSYIRVPMLVTSLSLPGKFVAQLVPLGPPLARKIVSCGPVLAKALVPLGPPLAKVLVSFPAHNF